ncbi:hypothetical protein LTR85_003989 [Meristemomyces frigidus]|nr:hypothetical protein LTR85_003989 [Meristemomyces frigidus]
MTSILWKLWRHQFRAYGIPFIPGKQIWTNISHTDDGMLEVRYPRDNTEALSLFLNSAHCFGFLDAEKVYREPVTARGTAAQQPLVLKVQVNPPWKPKHDPRNKLTRLDVAMPISHVLENFRKATVQMTANGDTALWDALALAKDQLMEYDSKSPSAARRIVVISDEIVMDSVSLGEESNSEPCTMSYLLGSYRFHPTSLANAPTVCEMEPFLSITERPTVTPPFDVPTSRLQYMSHFWNARFLATPTTVTSDDMPQHPSIDDEFVELKSAISCPATNNGGTRSILRIRRLMAEMRNTSSGVHPT